MAESMELEEVLNNIAGDLTGGGVQVECYGSGKTVYELDANFIVDAIDYGSYSDVQLQLVKEEIVSACAANQSRNANQSAETGTEKGVAGQQVGDQSKVDQSARVSGESSTTESVSSGTANQSTDATQSDGNQSGVDQSGVDQSADQSGVDKSGVDQSVDQSGVDHSDDQLDDPTGVDRLLVDDLVERLGVHQSQIDQSGVDQSLVGGVGPDPALSVPDQGSSIPDDLSFDIGDQPSVLAEQSSVFGEQSSILVEPSVVVEQSSVFGDQSSIVAEQSSVFGQQLAIIAEQSTCIGDQSQPELSLVDQSASVAAGDATSPVSDPQNIDGTKKSYECKTCDRKFSTSAKLNKHSLHHSSPAKHECELCGKIFLSLDNLRVHIVSHTSLKVNENASESGSPKSEKCEGSGENLYKRNLWGDKQYQCLICDKKMKDFGHLLQHIKTHIGYKPSMCEVCKKLFLGDSAITDVSAHNGKRINMCKLCSKQFSYDAKRLRDPPVLSGVPFQCELCGLKFSKLSNFEHHRQRHDETRYSCYICNREFATSVGLKSHLLTHTSGDTLKCEACDEIFTGVLSLKEHLLTHTVKKFKCDICDLQLSSNINLKFHMAKHKDEQINNENVKVEVSQDCNTSENQIDNETCADAPSMSCVICDKSFTVYHHLHHHILTHVGSKQLKCKVCDSQYTESCKDSNHVFILDKPHKCIVCDESFHRLIDKKRHMLTHTGPWIRDKIKSLLGSDEVSIEPVRKQDDVAKPPADIQFKVKFIVSIPNGVDLNDVNVDANKSVSCEVCGERFPGINPLVIHMTSHAVECGICEKQFFLPKYLDKHILKHFSKNVYKCKVCKKDFTDAGLLKAHMSAHDDNPNTRKRKRSNASESPRVKRARRSPTPFTPKSKKDQTQTKPSTQAIATPKSKKDQTQTKPSTQVIATPKSKKDKQTKLSTEAIVTPKSQTPPTKILVSPKKSQRIVSRRKLRPFKHLKKIFTCNMCNIKIYGAVRFLMHMTRHGKKKVHVPAKSRMLQQKVKPPALNSQPKTKNRKPVPKNQAAAKSAAKTSRMLSKDVRTSTGKKPLKPKYISSDESLSDTSTDEEPQVRRNLRSSGPSKSMSVPDTYSKLRDRSRTGDKPRLAKSLNNIGRPKKNIRPHVDKQGNIRVGEEPYLDLSIKATDKPVLRIRTSTGVLKSPKNISNEKQVESPNRVRLLKTPKNIRTGDKPCADSNEKQVESPTCKADEKSNRSRLVKTPKNIRAGDKPYVDSKSTGGQALGSSPGDKLLKNDKKALGNRSRLSDKSLKSVLKKDIGAGENKVDKQALGNRLSTGDKPLKNIRTGEKPTVDKQVLVDRSHTGDKPPKNMSDEPGEKPLDTDEKSHTGDELCPEKNTGEEPHLAVSYENGGIGKETPPVKNTGDKPLDESGENIGGGDGAKSNRRIRKRTSIKFNFFDTTIQFLNYRIDDKPYMEESRLDEKPRVGKTRATGDKPRVEKNRATGEKPRMEKNRMTGEKPRMEKNLATSEKLQVKLDNTDEKLCVETSRIGEKPCVETSHIGEKPCVGGINNNTSIDSGLLVENPEVPPKPVELDYPTYKCMIKNCDRVYDTPEKYEQHSLLHNKKVFQCSTCDKLFFKSYNFKRHLTTHRGNYKCDVCGKSFQSFGEIDDHECYSTTPKVAVKTQRCGICHERFPNLKFHMLSHQTSHECPICNKRFIESADLNSHMSAHSSEISFKCEICFRKFATVYLLTCHRAMHTAKVVLDRLPLEPQIPRSTQTIRAPTTNKHKCEICSKTFSRPSKLNSHKLTHNIDLIRCEICNAKFFHSYKYKLHMLRHTGEKPFKCEVCHERFVDNASLKRHEFTHDESTENNVEGRIEKFCERLGLRQTGDKPPTPTPTQTLIKCEECGEKFTATEITKHTLTHRTHNELKSPTHKCEVCNKTFSLSFALNRHLLTHGVNRFKCRICGEQFKHKATLRKHSLKHS